MRPNAASDSHGGIARLAADALFVLLGILGVVLIVAFTFSPTAHLIYDQVMHTHASDI
jgi:hypothetical protein